MQLQELAVQDSGKKHLKYSGIMRYEELAAALQEPVQRSEAYPKSRRWALIYLFQLRKAVFRWSLYFYPAG